LVRCLLLLGRSEFLLIDRHPELRELELKQLARVLLSDDSSPTLVALKTKIKSYADGQLQHAEHIFPAIYELMESDGPIEETPLPLPVSSNQQVAGVDWDGLKNALTTSLTSGTFLDSQFYAAESRSSTGSPKLRPVYFCSTAGGSFASKPLARGYLALFVCVGVLLINRCRLLKTQGAEGAASSM
jgi:hypothetical protein